MVRKSPLDYELIIPEIIWEQLSTHLFPGDQDEHGAVIAASISSNGHAVKLLARHLFIAGDGTDYLPSPRGYRMLSANFVRDQALFCRDNRLAYLAIHNHGGSNTVEFSRDDLASHERGYPALQDITRGQIVGGLVFAKNAVAGDLWVADKRVRLKRAQIVGKNISFLYPSPQKLISKSAYEYDRQTRIFGDAGQEILRKQRVAIVGLGGIGSLVCEYLSRLGVGTLILIDPDRLDVTNIPRVVGSKNFQTLPFKLLRQIFKKAFSDIGRLKVDIAEREARKANPNITIVKHPSNVVDSDVAMDLCTCDYIFLAADTMQARLIFNSIVNQYLIPGCQLGSKVSFNKVTGEIDRAFSVIRPVLPGRGCLWCNGLITPEGLQKEALTEEERIAQKYVDDEDVSAPSVITLNAVSASHAVNDYLFRITGLRQERATDDYIYFEPGIGLTRYDTPRGDPTCSECSTLPDSRFAMGDGIPLPVRIKK